MRIKIKPELREPLTSYIESLGLSVKVLKYNKNTEMADIIFTTPPTPSQVDMIVNQIPLIKKALNYTGIDNYDAIFENLSSEKLESYIVNNVTDLASARQYIIRLSKATLFLYKKFLEDGL